jgi:hypothetical protein
MDYIVKILRTLFFNLDKVVYEGVGNVYDLLLRIARTTIFNSDTIDGFYTRIYALIGIFMLFKVTISLINYILNPDDFNDKEKGVANISKRIIISLVMLVIVPFVFREAYELQTIILEDNTLLALVFGTPTGTEDELSNTYKLDSAGDKMKFVLMYTFFQPNYNELYDESGATQLASCAITYDYNDDGSIVFSEGKYTLNEECFGTYSDSDDKYTGSTYQSFWGTKDDLYQTYAQGVARQNFYLMFKHDIAMIQSDAKKTYLVNYMAPLSTAVGVAVLWCLLMFCIDVAIRSVKLGFYELIAPIPILSYIDPKSKDGMFSKWIKQCLTTYASLFLRLIALYIAIFIIFSVSTNGITDVITGEKVTDWWVCIFIIIGVLIFAKQLPKILEDALGFKGTGDFTLNPLKKLEDNMLGGKALMKPVKAGGKMAVGAAKGLGAAALVGGAALATGQGFRLGAMGKAVLGGAKGEKFGKNFAASYGAGRARKKQLDQMAADGVTAGQVRGAKLYNALHGETRAEHQKSVASKMEAVTKTWDTVKSSVTAVDKEAKTLKAIEEGVKQGGVTAFSDRTVSDGMGGYRVETAAEQYANAIKKAGDDLDKRVNDVATGRAAINDGTADGSAGGAAATARIANLNATMDQLINQINTESISYTDPITNTTRTVHVDSHDAAGNRVDVKNVAKAMQGEMGAWQASSGYVTTEDVGKYADGGKK